MSKRKKIDDELDGASPGLRQAILVNRHGRRSPARETDAPRPKSLPGAKPAILSGQLALGEDVDEEAEEPAA